MLRPYKKKIRKRDMPEDFEEQTVKAINRICECPNVVGVLYLRNGFSEMYTLPETTAQVVSAKLPHLTSVIHRAVTELSASINTVNPVIDRIMEDESVEGVIMTNKEGAPILTNVSLTTATNYGLKFNRYGTLAQNYMKELDPFDTIIVMRLNTKKIEIMVAPDPEFNIIVLQHSRHKAKLADKKLNK